MIDIQRKKLALQKFEIEKLLKKIEALKRNYEGLSNSSITEKNDYLRLKRENEHYSIEVDKLRGENQDLTTREQEYKEQLERMIDVQTELKNRIDSVSHESKVKIEENRKLKKHYEDKMKDLTASNKKLSDEYQIYKDTLAKKNDKINSLLDKVNYLTEQVSRSQGNSTEKTDLLAAENEKLRQQILDLQDQKPTHQYQQRSEQRPEHQKELSVKVDRSEIEKLQQLLHESQNERDELEDRLQVLENESQKGVNDNSSGAKDLESQNQKLLSEKNDQETKIKDMSKDINGLVQDLKDAKVQISEKNRSLSEKEDSLLKLQEQIQELTRQLEEMRSGDTEKETQVQTRIQFIMDEKARMQNQISQMEKLQQAADAKLSEKAQEYKDLQSSMKIKLEAMHNDLEKQKKAAKLENQELKDKLSQAERTLTQAQLETEKIKEEKESLGKELEETKKKLNDCLAFKEAIFVILKKILKNYEPINSNLSCLSCLNFLENPLMLI